MSFKLNIASGIAMSATALFTLFAAEGSGAAATSLQDPASAVSYPLPEFSPADPALHDAAHDQAAAATGADAAAEQLPYITAPMTPAPDADPAEFAAQSDPARFREDPVVQPVPAAPSADAAAPAVPAGRHRSLAALVSATPMDNSLSRELHCLAGAIYFESKGETLDGQLAVGRVIINRAQSGRFPASYCGVVYQRSQFSFVRGNSMPAINRSSRDWQLAVRIAQIAHSDAWESPVEGALFFHARYVQPNWRLRRMATVDNHVFYR